MNRILITALAAGSLLTARELESPRTPSLPALKAASETTFPGSGSRSSGQRTDTTTIWFDDLEGSLDDWMADPGWNLTTTSSYSPTHSYNVGDETAGSLKLTSPTITLPDLDNANQMIKFNLALWCDLPDWDGDGDNYLEDYYRVEMANLSNIPLYFHTSATGGYNGTSSWWCADPSIGGYSDNWLQALESPEFTVSGTAPVLTFKMSYTIEEYVGAPTVIDGCTITGWDAANVRISTDGGATWSVLTGSPAYTYSSCYGWFSNGEPCTTPGWGANSGSWIDGTFDLSTYTGQNVKLRFYFGTDVAWSTPDDPGITGFHVDNIFVSNSSGDTLLFDNADDAVVMSPVTGGSYQWEDVFYDYGDVTRPGAAGWVVYMPGDPFNGNAQLDLSAHAGSDIKLRFTARIDDNDDGGNGSGLYIDDIHVWKVNLGASVPVIQNLVAVAGDNRVTLTWDDLNTGGGFNGLISYDDGGFENAIGLTSPGEAYAGTLFETPFGVTAVTVNEVKVFGYSGATGSTNIYGFGVTAGTPNAAPLYSAAITLSPNVWNTVPVTGWSFDGDFVIALGITDVVSVALDENTAPSSHSWANLGTAWATWSSVALANGLPDGEWGIRADVTSTGGIAATYNVYRSLDDGQTFNLMFNGQGLTNPAYTDIMAFNWNTYCYQVTAVYDTVEGAPSEMVCATPEPQTMYELIYDDDDANTSTNVTAGNYLAVRFTPAAYPSVLKRIKYYITGSQSGIAVAQVWDDDGGAGMPGTEILSGLIVQLVPGWTVKDVSSQNITIPEGDFYVGWREVAQTPPIGVDTDSPPDRSVVNITGSWEPFSNYFTGALMIRVEMDSAAVGIDQELTPDIPVQFGLGQNFPNPFNPLTRIAFELPEPAHAVLTLYDLSGRQVMTILDRDLGAGYFRYQLEAGHLPSGVYFYHLEAVSGAGNTRFSAVRKMLLIK